MYLFICNTLNKTKFGKTFYNNIGINMYCVYKIYFKERHTLLLKYIDIIKDLKSCQPCMIIQNSCSHTYDRDWSFN